MLTFLRNYASRTDPDFPTGTQYILPSSARGGVTTTVPMLVCAAEEWQLLVHFMPRDMLEAHIRSYLEAVKRTTRDAVLQNRLK